MFTFLVITVVVGSLAALYSGMFAGAVAIAHPYGRRSEVRRLIFGSIVAALAACAALIALVVMF